MTRKMGYTVFSDGDDEARVFFNAENLDTASIHVHVPGIKHEPQAQVKGEHRRLAIQRARDVADKFINFSSDY